MANENLSALGAAALGYARQGWPVIPLHIPKGPDVCNCAKGAGCPSIGKHPVPRRGLNEASTVASQLGLWWTKMPSANIGIRTGADAGIFVLDVDLDEAAGKNGFATLADLEAKHGPLPLTRMAITGRGGRHYVFRHPGGDVRIKNSAEKTLGKGLDVRGDGGYIVAPPSLHASGRHYIWENDLEPADAPEWLVDLVKKKDTEPSAGDRPRSAVVQVGDERARKYGLAALDSAARELAAVTKGGRNQELNRAAFKAAQLSVACGISEAVAEAFLLDAAAACGLLKEDGHDQCVKTFRSGWQQGLGKPREYTPPDREVPAPTKRKPAPPAGEFNEDLVADYEARGEELAEEDDDQADGEVPLDDDGAGKVAPPYGLDLSCSRYRIGPWGVRTLKGNGEGFQSVLPRPLWPAALGVDVTTGADMVKLAWVATDGRERSQWVRAGIAGDRQGIYALADRGAPVTIGNAPRVADWLGEAAGLVLPEHRGALVASTIGWAELPGRGPCFVWPGVEDVEFIGEPLPSKGKAGAWAEGLQLLADLGEGGYMGLAAVGLAAAAPLVRHIGRRRPILGIAATSSTGKTSILTYALSVWASPEALTIQSMNSTPKGVEEAAVCVPDLPVLLDDFQEPASEKPGQAGHALYFLGNGQQRTTAKKDGGASGGRPRWGVAFYAAEYSIAGAMQGGADRRVVELTARPLPAGRSDLSDRIKAIGTSNGGAIAGALLTAIGPRAAELAQRADQDSRDLRDGFEGLKGDDALTASLAGIGLDLLAEATGITLPAGEVAAWLAGEAAAVRDERPDQSEEAFAFLVRIVDSAEWSKGRAVQGGFEIAFSTDTVDGPALDVNPTHEAIRRGLEAFGGEKRHRAAWVEKGLIVRDGKNLLAQKKLDGKKLRVLRILREVCEREGMRVVPIGNGQVDTRTGQVGTTENVLHRGF